MIIAKTKKIKLSIIIPIYNVEQYIKDCLDSIYDGRLNDFEVICIDDCGNDNSVKIVKKYINQNKLKNITIIKHEKNKGLSESRNTGINNAKGDYICFLDSDDMIDSNGLNILVNYAKKNRLDIIEGNIEEIFETSLNIKIGDKKEKRNDTSVLNGDQYFSRCCKKAEYFPMTVCRVYRTNFLKNKYYFKPGLKFEDEEFSPKVIINAHKIQYINIPFYIYRRRDNSITTNMFKDYTWFESYLYIIQSLEQFCENIKAKESYKYLKNRIAQITLSILKNPVAYGANKEIINDVIEKVKNTGLYKIPLKSNNIFIKIQGLIMRFPKVFVKLYSCRSDKNEKNI